MRILLLTHNYEPEVGAPQQRWGSLIRRFQRTGHEIDVITPPPHFPSGALLDSTGEMRPGRIHCGRHGEQVHRVRFRPYAHAVGSRLVDQVVSASDTTRVALTRFRSNRPDVVIATAPAIPTLASGAVVARSLRVPLVTEMRDAWPDLLAVADEWNLSLTPTPPSRISALARPRLVHAAALVTAGLHRRSAAVVTTTETFA